MTAFFTIKTQTQGFTDQLMQFSAFYKLGRSLGFTFIYSPLISHRSRPLVGRAQNNTRDVAHHDHEDIFTFLGFNEHFENQMYSADDELLQSIEIELSDSILQAEHIEDYSGLKSYVKQKVLDSSRDHDRYPLVILRLERKVPPLGKGKRAFFSIIHNAVTTLPDELNFRSLYDRRRQDHHVDSAFPDDGRIKLLLHIRQGDTSFIQTPWDTYIPVDGRRPDYLIEQSDYSVLKTAFSNNFVDSIFDPEDYVEFVQRLLARFEHTAFSVRTFSDGYQRAFAILKENIAKLQISSKGKAELLACEHEYDRKKFMILDEIADSRSQIGESLTNLHCLIQSALEADILLVAAQQRMLPKLVSLYCNEKHPVVIVLYRMQPPNYGDLIKNHTQRFVYTNIDDPDFERIGEALTRLKKA
ncbi:MAG: hypothetical protein AAGI24_02130 [Pseudomonadota bacterium]